MNSISPFEQLFSICHEEFEQGGYISKPELVKLTSTSKYFLKFILENEKNKETTRLKNFISWVSSQEIKIKYIKDISFKSCKNIFDLEVAKIKKFVEIFHFLNKLGDLQIEDLKKKFSTKNFSSVFKRIFEALKTETDLMCESDDTIINYLMSTGQFIKFPSSYNLKIFAL